MHSYWSVVLQSLLKILYGAAAILEDEFWTKSSGLPPIVLERA